MRIALGIEYDGQPFRGWQIQQNLPTVQGYLEEAFSKIADKPIQVFCAGRTDAGVHASGQVIHFETEIVRSLRAWTIGANTHLPSSIAVRWAQFVDDDFHARFSALFRRYRYIIHNHSARSALLASKVSWHYPLLDAARMDKAGHYLLGELDFTSFRSAQCESTTPMRNVREILVKRHADFIIIEIEANAFLHHMVRNIVGVLIRIGSGEKSPEWAEEVLFAKDRRKAAETAPADGLYLIQVHYPDHYQLPAPPNCVLFL
jgi:tRNA pseudouridine38-40 synthase